MSAGAGMASLAIPDALYNEHKISVEANIKPGKKAAGTKKVIVAGNCYKPLFE